MEAKKQKTQQIKKYFDSLDGTFLKLMILDLLKKKPSETVFKIEHIFYFFGKPLILGGAYD